MKLINNSNVNILHIEEDDEYIDWKDMNNDNIDTLKKLLNELVEFIYGHNNLINRKLKKANIIGDPTLIVAPVAQILDDNDEYDVYVDKEKENKKLMAKNNNEELLKNRLKQIDDYRKNNKLLQLMN